MVKREMMSSNLKSFVLDYMSLCVCCVSFRVQQLSIQYVYRMFSLKKESGRDSVCVCVSSWLIVEFHVNRQVGLIYCTIESH